MSEERKTTEAQRRAIYNYDKKHERINCRFQIGTKKRIKALKYSANDFIKLAVAEKLEREEKNIKIRHKKLLTYKAQDGIIDTTNHTVVVF